MWGCREWKRKQNAGKEVRKEKRPRSDAQGEVKFILPLPEKCPNQVSDAARRSPRPLPPTPVRVVRGGDDAMDDECLGDAYMYEVVPALPASVTRTARVLSSVSRQSGYTVVDDEVGDLYDDDPGSDLDL